MIDEIQKQKRHSRATFRCSKWRRSYQNEINVQSIVENGLIECEGGQTYRTTEKGMRVIHLQNGMDEVAPVSFIKE